MFLDIDPVIVKADRQTKYIMMTCHESAWIRFIDLNDEMFVGIVDFRSDEHLKKFLPNIPVSRFMKQNQMGRIKAIRSNRKNLLRHSLPWYSKQWNSYYHYTKDGLNYPCYFSESYSKEFLAKYKRMNLQCIKMV